MAERPKKPYVPIEVFKKNRDWSSRVIHDMHHWQRPYSADVTPSKMTFGSVAMGTLSAAQTGTVRNTGYRPLRILSITAVGEFLVTHDAPLVLYPGETFDLSVIFKPQRTGLCSGGVYIDTGDAAGKEFIEFMGFGGEGSVTPELPTLSISDGVLEDYDVPEPELPTLSIADGVLEEYGVVTPTLSIADGVLETVSNVEISPTSLSFGEVQQGTTSSPKTLTISNGTATTVTIDRVLVDSTVFSLVPGQALDGAEISPGEDLVVHFTFTPSALGSQTATITFEMDPSSATVSATATGLGIQDQPVVALPRLSTLGNQIVDPDGNPVPLKGVNWFGAEGENLAPHGIWGEARYWKDILAQIKEAGFNCIRLPFCLDMVNNDTVPKLYAIDYLTNPEFLDLTSLQIFALIIDECTKLGLYVLLDNHRHHPGNTTDGGPVLPGAMSDWLMAWETLAIAYADNTTVIGADIWNEPHNLDWNTWATAAEQVGNHIHTFAPDWLIVVEGVGSYNNVPYWWGGQLAGVRDRPVVLTIPNRLVYSPHEYGQSVSGQQWLAYDNQTPPANWPNNLFDVWFENWSFIHFDKIAPILIGEMGGQFGLNGSGQYTVANRVPETAWMTTLMKHMLGQRAAASVSTGERMSFTWWSYNPNSTDTGGLLQDDWLTWQQPKLDLIQPLLT